MNTITTYEEHRKSARLLYTQLGHNLDSISATTDVPKSTLQLWMKQDKWDEHRKSLLTTKHHQLTQLYDALAQLTNPVPEEKYEKNENTGEKKEEKESKPAPKEIDKILKLTNAIKNLETEASVGQIFEVGQLFINWVCKNDRDKGREIITLYDTFIREQLNIAA